VNNEQRRIRGIASYQASWLDIALPDDAIDRAADDRFRQFETRRLDLRLGFAVSGIQRNFRKGGFEGWMLHVMGFGGDRPVVPLVEKLLMVQNAAQLRQQFLDWAAIPDLRRVIMSHGEPIETRPSAALRQLAGALN